ncbi:MAG TPA: hypothetical protein VGF24_21840 [Vicinamibacterales bacterium]
MFDWLILASWVLAVLLLFLWRRKAVNSPWAVLALGGHILAGARIGFRRGGGRVTRRPGGGFIPNGGGGFTPEDGSSRHPFDPFSRVRHPNAPRLGGNSAAVAMEEPDEDQPLTLVGTSR